MISCTEFIPLYSELFQYIEDRRGKEGVIKYWEYISDAYVAPRLGAEVEKHGGMRGCWEYWSKSLNEEAADFTMTFDPDAEEFSIVMHHCPSKGMLDSFTHFEPYNDYCGHCDLLYARVLEKYGIKFTNTVSKTCPAACVCHATKMK